MALSGLKISNNDKNNTPDNDGLNSRSVALDIVTQVLSRKRALDHILEGHEDYLKLSAQDKGFVRMLVATIFRRKGQLDDVIARAMDKGQEPRPETLKHILYIGITQLLFMDVPDHAAVDTSVELAALNHMEKQKGFVNAILRRMTSEGVEWLKGQSEAESNIAEWLYRQWVDDYGAGEAEEIALASLTEAHLDITVKDKNSLEYWAQELGAHILPTGSLRRSGGGNITNLSGFEDGQWWVQDASAAMPVKLFDDIEGKKIIDLCAAPGGKTAQLAAMGAHVIAVDRSAQRMKILEENLRRLHLKDSVEIIISDGSEWQPPEKVDCVLLDAPCTATGTIRRHPDILHLKEQRDQDSLADIQSRLLENAAHILKPGGILVYCTCSLQKAEGEYQIDSFLASHEDFERIPIRTGDIDGIAGPVTKQGDVRILPYHLSPHGGMDGFFIARLQKS